jgi:hypothetical protein
MARFHSSKRSKELQRKAKHEAKEARKKARQETPASGAPDDDIDWSQAVGIDPPPGTFPEGEETAEEGAEDAADDGDDTGEERDSGE